MTPSAPELTWVPVESSRFRAYAWQPFDNGQAGLLHIQFTDGTTGYYSGVPADVARQMASAPSKGSFLHQSVIKQGYPWVKVSGKTGSLT